MGRGGGTWPGCCVTLISRSGWLCRTSTQAVEEQVSLLRKQCQTAGFPLEIRLHARVHQHGALMHPLCKVVIEIPFVINLNFNFAVNLMKWQAQDFFSSSLGKGGKGSPKRYLFLSSDEVRFPKHQCWVWWCLFKCRVDRMMQLPSAMPKKAEECQKRWPLAMSKEKTVDFIYFFSIASGGGAGVGRIVAW